MIIMESEVCLLGLHRFIEMMKTWSKALGEIEAKITERSRPPEWDNDDSLDPCSLKVVAPNSSEFAKVLSLVLDTLPNVRIIKLERIQNQWFWTKYYQHR